MRRLAFSVVLAPPRASPALLSVLWASLARAPLRCAKGAWVVSLDTRLRGYDGGGHTPAGQV